MMTVVWRQNRTIDANKPTLDLESSELKYIVRGALPSIYRLYAVSLLPIAPLRKFDLTPATVRQHTSRIGAAVGTTRSNGHHEGDDVSRSLWGRRPHNTLFQQMDPKFHKVTN